MTIEQNTINKDRQIMKFCTYGFLKNLKFFEPYLLIYLIGMRFSLFQIGILFAIREIITYVFEIPSGIIADNYGKKKELLVCFVFYIVSFVFFFWSKNIVVISIGMVFFGLGEAFRSGTHKAMILGYLEHRGWYQHKVYVYGRTRSYSLLGSSISAFLSILLILNLPAVRWIFLVCIIPYLLDFILIASYPAYLDGRTDTQMSLREFYQSGIDNLKSIGENKTLRKILLSAASYDGVFRSIKDYIQPIMSALILSAGIGAFLSLDSNQTLKVYLGIIYGVFYIFSSFASRNIYRVTKKINAQTVFEKSFGAMGILLVILSLAIWQELMFIAIGIYFVLYLLMDARRPVFFDVCSDHMGKEQRATVLSVESQIRAIFVVVMAPLFGWIADVFSIQILFMGIGIVLLIANRILTVKSSQY